MEDLSEYFKPETSSIQSFFLTQIGTGFAVPVYQRPYSWDNDKITKLVSDISHGYASLADNPKSATYLGAVITVTQSGNEIFGTKRTLPGNILSVIDGQQRISTLLLLISALHERISELFSQLNFKGSDEELRQTVSQLTNSTKKELRDILGLRFPYYNPRPCFPFYPRLIRAYTDKWEPVNLLYRSPIAMFLKKYDDHVENLENNPPSSSEEYAFDIDSLKPTSPDQEDNFNKVKTAYKHLRKLLKVFEKTIGTNKNDTLNKEEIEALDVEALINQKSIQERLFRDGFESSVRDSLLKGTPQAKISSKLLQFIGLASYLKSRVALTKVETKADEYAFEIFEALNATGEPLTAIETFKPQVYQGKDPDSIKASDAYRWMEQIERNLGAEATKDKNKRTNEVLTSFALATAGVKLLSRLNDQRQFLKLYDSLSIPVKDTFVHDLCYLTDFYKHLWWNENKGEVRTYCRDLSDKDIDLLQLCFHFLCELKHSITVSTLFHFYRQVRLNPTHEAQREFLEAVKACAAFSTIWRGAKGSTDKIDSIYRSFCKDGYKKDDGTVLLEPLALLDKNLSYRGPSSSHRLKQAMKERLAAAGLETQQKWMEAAKEIPIYDKSEVVTKFLLMFAANDAICTQDGLVRGKKGSVPVLDVESWNTTSVEHIAPQTADGDWKNSKYLEVYNPQGKRYLHGLGNLLLLPKEVNSSLQNKDWEYKKKIYMALAQKDPQKAQGIIDGLELKKETVAALQSQQKYFVLVENIVGPTYSYSAWLPALAEARGEILLQLAFDNLFDFLN